MSGSAVARAAVAALLLVASAGCAASTDEATPAPAAGHTWDQTHRLDLRPGWTVAARNVDTTDESTSLSGPGGAGCLVSTYASAPEQHARPVAPRTVTVQGRDAAYGELDHQYGPYPRAVLWTDADGRWFRVACELDEAEILQVAEGVHAGRNPMRVPFRLRSPVEGAALVGLIEDRRGKVPVMSALFETPGPRTPTMEISSGTDRPPDDGQVERERIGDRLVEVRRSAQSMCLSTGSVPVCVSGPSDEPATDWSDEAYPVARRTVELLEAVGDPTDPATWLDADAAFPR